MWGLNVAVITTQDLPKVTNIYRNPQLIPRTTVLFFLSIIMDECGKWGIHAGSYSECMIWSCQITFYFLGRSWRITLFVFLYIIIIMNYAQNESLDTFRGKTKRTIETLCIAILCKCSDGQRFGQTFFIEIPALKAKCLHLSVGLSVSLLLKRENFAFSPSYYISNNSGCWYE